MGLAKGLGAQVPGALGMIAIELLCLQLDLALLVHLEAGLNLQRLWPAGFFLHLPKLL